MLGRDMVPGVVVVPLHLVVRERQHQLVATVLAAS
jgi:hypothetical protein